MTMKIATKRVFECYRCGRRLKNGRYIYSAFTRCHYCWPGEGCQRKARSKKARA